MLSSLLCIRLPSRIICRNSIVRTSVYRYNPVITLVKKSRLLISITKYWYFASPEIAEHVSESFTISINKKSTIMSSNPMSSTKHRSQTRIFDWSKCIFSSRYKMSTTYIQVNNIFSIQRINLFFIFIPTLLICF